MVTTDREEKLGVFVEAVRQLARVKGVHFAAGLFAGALLRLRKDGPSSAPPTVWDLDDAGDPLGRDPEGEVVVQAVDAWFDNTVWRTRIPEGEHRLFLEKVKEAAQLALEDLGCKLQITEVH